MVANKDMEMPNGCILVTTRPFYSDEVVYNYCPFYNICDHVDFGEVNVRPNDCPLVEIVTCKDCIHYDKELKECMVNNIQCNDDFYCADAER